MSKNKLMLDALKVAADAEDVARRFAEVRDIPSIIAASLLTRILEIKDLMLLIERELRNLTPGNIGIVP